MRLNEAGRMVVAEWEEIPERFPHIELDAFVVMPNHIHGIIVITETKNLVGAGLVPAQNAGRNDVGAGLVPAPYRATTYRQPQGLPLPLGM
ncbi:MAG: hypothetical protein ACP5JH_06800 [Bacteroidota bacterium]